MAYFTGTVYSKCLLQDTSFHVILPQDGRRYIWDTPPKTLILLHGLSDSAATWVRRTAIERYAERYNLAVVIPEVQRSYYHDMVNGIKAFTYITQEVPELAEKMFHLSTKKEDLLIAGLSMGGYGALRCALEAPERFGYCGAFSGCYDLADLYRMAVDPNGDAVLEGLESDYRAVFGEKSEIPENASYEHFIKAAAGRKDLPKIYMMCGTDDFLYGHTCRARQLCAENGIEVDYEEWPGYHEWDMWDEAIERMLKKFLGPGRKDY